MEPLITLGIGILCVLGGLYCLMLIIAGIIGNNDKDIYSDINDHCDCDWHDK